MTTEEDFQAALDLYVEDHHTRVVFADWLQERNDPRADGYRLLGLLRLHPMNGLSGSHVEWFGWYGVAIKWYSLREPKDLPSLEWREAASRWIENDGSQALSSAYPTRREADDAAAIGFTRLSDDLRARLWALCELESRPRDPLNPGELRDNGR